MRGVVLAATLLLAACGSGSSTGGESSSTPSPAAPPTPTPGNAATPSPLPSPGPAPTLVATQTVLARDVRGAGHVAVASDGNGFLAVWIGEDDMGLPSIVGVRLDADGSPLDDTPITIAIAGDIENGVPSDEPFAFDDLVVGFDGTSYVVTWHATRVVYQFASEETVLARRVGRDDGEVFGLQQLSSELTNVGICNGATSGPLAAATLPTGMLLFSVAGYGCVDSAVTAAPWIYLLTDDPSTTRGLGVDPPVGVRGVGLVRFLLTSTASAASRGSDALVRWLGAPTEDGGPPRNGLWIDGPSARPIDLGGTTDVASDGLGYLVLASDPAGASGSRELRAAPFDPATLAIDDAAGVVVASGDHGATALASFGPRRYLAACADGASVLLTALTLGEGGDTSPRPVATLDGGTLLQMRAASASRTALLLLSRRAGAESFTVDGVAVAIR